MNNSLSIGECTKNKEELKFAYSSKCVCCGMHVVVPLPLKLSQELHERIETLEAENKRLNIAFGKSCLPIIYNDGLRKDLLRERAENERLREALRYYAQAKHFDEVQHEGETYYPCLEFGTIARKALGGEG